MNLKPKISTFYNGIEFVRIPSGKFLMGGPEKRISTFDVERPRHIVEIPYEYWVARFPVTNGLYNFYAKDKKVKHPVFDWNVKGEHPVINVKWANAIDYCQWLCQILERELPSKLTVRLLNEAEWEKAARGENGYKFPWGDKFDKDKCNTSEGEKNGTTPVGFYSPHGDSPYGCADMAGNVWEWVYSSKSIYQYNDKNFYKKDKIEHTLRGGSFYLDMRVSHGSYRRGLDVMKLHNIRGFRVCIAPPLPK